jgi:hypothetical protein
VADFAGEGFRICTQVPSPIPPTPPSLIEAVADGPIEGGTILTLIGGTSGGSPNIFIDTSRDDDFAGVVIDPAKWVASTAGSGTVVQNDDLRLRTGTAVLSEAVLTSFDTFDPVSEVQVGFSIVTSVVRFPPAATTRFLDFELRVDATNYFRVSREYDASLPAGRRDIFRVTCIVGGATVEHVIIENDTRGGVLRLTRVRNRVIVRANSFVIYDGAPFVAQAPAYVVFRSVNPSATQPYDCTVALDSFVVPAMVLFGNEPALVREVAADYIRTESPEVRTPRTVTLRVYTASGFLTELVDAFGYFLTFEFRVLSNPAGTSIGIVNDRALRNMTAGRPGLLT